MRVSTNTVYDLGTSAILQQQEAHIKTQQQVATGKRILTPSDDPIAAAQALSITQAASLNEQYITNRKNAISALGLEENVLKGVTTLIQDAHQIMVYAGNPTLTSSDRRSLAVDLKGKLDSLVNLANTTDGTGQFLFSGFQAFTTPFVQTGLSVQYNGDQGQRLNQVSTTRQIPVGDAGTDVFERIKNGNGIFVTAADPANLGTGIITTGSVIAPASLTGDNYQVVFTVAAGVTTYDVINTTTSTTLSTANPYTSATTISFDGMQFSIEGDPSNGDIFTVLPGTNESIFKTIGDFITTLDTVPTNIQPGGGTKLTNNLNTAIQNLQNSLDHILSTQASVGARFQELASLEDVGSDFKVQFAKTLSRLENIDLAEAISTLNRQQVYLEAAQKSFAKVSGLSLFDYI
jgi:flagellar hook-associated protein 3 FlgL